jgi:hypothetical protein
MTGERKHSAAGKQGERTPIAQVHTCTMTVFIGGPVIEQDLDNARGAVVRPVRAQS